MIELLILRTLLRRWYWLVVGAVLGAIVLLVPLAMETRIYTATVDIIPTRARTQVDLDARIRTISPDSAPGGGSLAGASAERRQALTSLVRNPDIEVLVQQQLGDRLPSGLRTRGALLGMVRGSSVRGSELISIVVSASNRELAELVASAWAREYEQHVNRVYSDGTGGNPAELALRVQEAEQAYTRAEVAFTSLLEASPIAELTRQLERRLMLLAEYQAHVQEQGHALRRVDNLLGNARAFQQQLQVATDPGVASTSASVLSLLKIQAFTELSSSPNTIASGAATASIPGAARTTTTGASNSPVSGAPSSPPGASAIQVQIVPSAITLASARDDVASIVVALESRRSQLQEILRVVAEAGVSAGSAASPAALVQLAGSTHNLTQIEQEVRELQARISELTARQNALQQERTLALESYTSLLKRLEEGRVIAALGSGREVVIANQVPAVATIAGPAVVRRAALGAVAGMGVALVITLALVFGRQLLAAGEADDARRMERVRTGGGGSVRSINSATRDAGVDEQPNGALSPSGSHQAMLQ